jgi:hypothetical protein
MAPTTARHKARTARATSPYPTAPQEMEKPGKMTSVLRRLFTFASVLSLLLCVGTCVLWAGSGFDLVQGHYIRSPQLDEQKTGMTLNYSPQFRVVPFSNSTRPPPGVEGGVWGNDHSSDLCAAAFPGPPLGG